MLATAAVTAAMAAAATAETVPRLLSSKSHSARTARENMLEVFSYVVSFSAFYVFVWVAMQMVKSPSFRRETSSWTRLAYMCAVGDDQHDYSDETVGSKAADAANVRVRAAMQAQCSD